jgi:hypothetical protein
MFLSSTFQLISLFRLTNNGLVLKLKHAGTFLSFEAFVLLDHSDNNGKDEEQASECEHLFQFDNTKKVLLKRHSASVG